MLFTFQQKPLSFAYQGTYSNQYRFSCYLGTKAFLEFSIFVVCLYERKISGCISLFCCTCCLYQFYSIYNCLVVISPGQISLVLKKFYTWLAFEVKLFNLISNCFVNCSPLYVVPMLSFEVVSLIWFASLFSRLFISPGFYLS